MLCGISVLSMSSITFLNFLLPFFRLAKNSETELPTGLFELNLTDAASASFLRSLVKFLPGRWPSTLSSFASPLSVLPTAMSFQVSVNILALRASKFSSPIRCLSKRILLRNPTVKALLSNIKLF
jgi:hypothetical protein